MANVTSSDSPLLLGPTPSLCPSLIVVLALLVPLCLTQAPITSNDASVMTQLCISWRNTSTLNLSWPANCNGSLACTWSGVSCNSTTGEVNSLYDFKYFPERREWLSFFNSPPSIYSTPQNCQEE